MSRTQPWNRVVIVLTLASLSVGMLPKAGLAAEGTVTTVAGGGSGRYSGDGGPATAAGLDEPRMLNFDTIGNAYIADTMNHVIRKVDLDGIITTVVGTGNAGSSGDGGPATDAEIKWPHSVVVNDAGDVLVADSPNHRIRRVDHASGVITTIAGTGRSGSSGDNGPAVAAELDTPKGLALDAAGDLLIADTNNHRVRKVDSSGIITTIVGTGSRGGDGDGGPAVGAKLYEPRTLAFDPAGNLYIAEPNAHRIRRVDADGTITRLAGTGDSGFSGDGGPATQAHFDTPRGVAADGAGNVYVADSLNHRIRRVDRSGTVTTVAGGQRGSGGDGGPAEKASFFTPRGVAVHRAGDVYVADTYNHKIRRIEGIAVPWPGAPPPVEPPPEDPPPVEPPTTPPVSSPPPGRGSPSASPSAPSVPAVGHLAPRSGYWMLRADGTVHAFGDVGTHPVAIQRASLPERAVDIEPTPSGDGYWLLDADGHVSPHGDAMFHGEMGRHHLGPGESATSISRAPAGAGYWVFTTAGRVVPFGNAAFYGDLSGVALNGPVLDSVATPSGRGYYLVASDGGVFAFGDAAFLGSMGGHRLNRPVQSLVPDGDGMGYWLVASDGGVFGFGAPFRGSMGSVPLNRPVTGMVRFGNGYLMVGEDGGIFNFSDRPFHGSLGAEPPGSLVVSVAAVDR